MVADQAAQRAAVVQRTRTCRGKVARRFLGALGDRDLARALERALWRYVIDRCEQDKIARYWENPAFRDMYTTKALSLEFNLKLPQNPRLLNRVLSGEVSLDKLVRMAPEDMFPEKYEEIHKRLATKRLKAMAIDAKDAPDGPEEHRCRKCKSLKTQYYSLQTRSADEPMTIFVSCLVCQKRWKY